MSSPACPVRAAALALLLLAPEAAATQFLYVGTDKGPLTTLRVYADVDQDGVFETLVQELQPFGKDTGGVRVATADLDGDGNTELVLGGGRKSGSRVDVYDVTSDGSLGARLETFSAFGVDTKEGVFVAAGDLDGDGRDELFVGGGAKSDGLVRVYGDADGDGLVGDDLLEELAPFGDPFRAGVTLAAGDTDGDGRDELFVGHGPGPKGRTDVVVLRDTDLDGLLSDEASLEAFTAFDGKQKGGVFLAAGPVEGLGTSGGAELFVSAARKLTEVAVFGDQDGDGLLADDPRLQTLVAYEGKAIKGGVRVAAGDTDDDGPFVELVTAPGRGRPPEVRVRDDADAPGAGFDDTPADAFLPFGAKPKRGLFLATGRVNAEVFASGAIADVPDDGPGGAVLVSSVHVPATAGTVRDLDVSLAIQHTFAADLEVRLRHVPSATELPLFADAGHNDDGFYVRLGDEFGPDIGDHPDDPNDRPVDGTFNPQGAAQLAVFDGLDASGEWQLLVDDDFAGLAGRLLGWELLVAYD